MYITMFPPDHTYDVDPSIVTQNRFPFYDGHWQSQQQSKASPEQSRYQILYCNECQNQIGHVDQGAEGYRLYKWRLRTADSKPSMASIITAQLQSIMLAQCTSRLLLLPLNWTPSSQQPYTPSIQQEPFQPENPSSQPIFLLLWVLNSAIRYTTTTEAETTKLASAPTSHLTGKLAMKVFWKVVSASAAEKLMEDNTRATEEVSLPAETILEIKKDLLDSALLLPPSPRKFQEWDVGLLERFEDTKWETSLKGFLNTQGPPYAKV